MADWRTGVSRALARWRAGDEAGALTMLAACLQAAGEHRGPLAALVEGAEPGAIADAERLMIALARRRADPHLNADLAALFAANGHVERLAELQGLTGAAARRFEGESHARAGRWIEARAAYAAWVALAPADAEARFRLALAARRLGALDEAEAGFAAALARDPVHPGAHAELGLSAWRRSDDATALRHLEAAHRAMPSQLGLAGYLAEAHADAGREAEAVAVLAATLRAGAPWPAARLTARAAELLANPRTYTALYRAVAEVAPEAAAACAARLRDRRPHACPELAPPWRELLALGEPRRASLCMIVRNESAHLGRLLDSIAGMADELVIVDTGSTDDTVAIADAHGARVAHMAWTGDFAEARNESLRHATGDWVLRLDADHVVDATSRRGFRRFLQRETHPGGHPVGYLVQLQEHLGGAAPAAKGRTLVLFARDAGLRYEGALHEQLVDTVPGRGLRLEALDDMIVHHTGYAGDNTERQARNVGILRRELEARPDDPALHHGLAQELRAMEDHAAAVAHLERARALVDPTSTQHAASTLLLADSHLQRRDWAAALAVLDTAIARGLSGADVFGMRGHARLMAGRTAEAIRDLDAAIAHRGAIGAGLLARGYDGWLTHVLLAFARDRAGDPAPAAEALVAAHLAARDDATLVRRVFALSEALTGTEATALRLLGTAGFDVRRAP